MSTRAGSSGYAGSIAKNEAVPLCKIKKRTICPLKEIGLSLLDDDGLGLSGGLEMHISVKKA